ncbi:MAG: tetratricopeptide repeat protein, partial [Chthoniobacterales bacterium]|nr:tetratricopeptide repeat protein [Chthoniobacterales bacterium]
YYLQRVRESGNEDDLPLALAAARASLAAIGAEQNSGGLTALAHAELANHDFAAARRHALRLVELNPTKSEPRAILGDACLELGDYELATEVFGEMEKLGANNIGTHTRLARLATLRGSPDQARAHFSTALILLLDSPSPPREAVAWYRWQLGETVFSTGDYGGAERHYRDALTTAPDYFRALGSMGRLCAARGDLLAAINFHEQAVRIAPSVNFMAALGDLYQLAGREREAATRYELVEQLGEHSRKVHGTPFDRASALYCADHDLKVEEAYALARGEYDAGRHDIYGADALAWTALKTNRIEEAQAAIKEALKLGTLDAKLFYHAGMIARRAGDRAAAADYLRRALALNPGFDLLQSEIARRTLKEISP